MPRIRKSVKIPLDSSAVWQRLSDIAEHSRWMKDALKIEFIGPQTSGLGCKFVCLTKVGPFITKDRMEVVEWVEGRSIGVHHNGLVKGWGRFVISPTGASKSQLSWEEDLSFPWYLGGRFTATIAKPFLGRIWKKNLSRFRDQLGQP